MHVALHFGESNSRTHKEGFLRTSPVEFLYLDSARIFNYVAELRGGEAGKVRLITHEIKKAKAEASFQGITLGGESQEEEEVESTIQPAAASEVWVMLKELRDDTWPHTYFHRLDLGSGSDLPEVREGWLVHFRTGRLISPGYIRPYEILRHSATLRALFAGTVPRPNASGQTQIEKAEAFAKEIGPNPRATLTLGREKDGPKVLMPVEYTNLIGERNILETGRSQFTGGELSVFGIVLRVIDDGSGELSYTDYASRETWRRPLKYASSYLIDHVSHRCQARRGKGVAHLANHPIEGRRCYLTRLRRETHLTAPGLVILPLAIYK